MNPMLRDELISILKEVDPPQLAPIDFTPVDVSPRAQSLRRILRIADTHGWHDAITMFLETKGVSSIVDLSEPQVDDLLDRMLGYVDAAEMGASLADCLPAS